MRRGVILGGVALAVLFGAGWWMRAPEPVAGRDEDLALADLYARHGRASEAVALSNAVAERDASAYARLRAAAALYRAGDFADAGRLYRALLDEGSDSPVVLYNLACVRLRQGDRAEAAKLFGQVADRFGAVLPRLAESARRMAASPAP